MTFRSVIYETRAVYYVLFAIVWSIFFVFLLQDVSGSTLLNSSIESVVFNTLLLIAALAASNVLRYYNPSRDQVMFMLGIALLFSLIVTFLDELIIKYLFGAWIEQSAVSTYSLMFVGYAFVVNAAAIFYSYLSEKNKEKQELNYKREEAEKLSKEAELLTLRHQLQPHFLFNSLNSINALVTIDQKQARQMVQQLSSFLRGTISAKHESLVPLKNELEQLQLYLEIEKVRFGHRLQVDLDLKADKDDTKLPMLLLQPLLENAIKFGLYGTTGDVHIQVSAIRNQDVLEVSISNPFDPDYKTMSGTGFGLSSIKRRLFLLYSRNDLLTTKAEEHTFTATLKIPQSND